ncbi:hypothetical protein FBT96_20310 [Rhodobacter capsulatus]|uniref:Uncharacterized protein n=1 Tax=Rhodobacter capsulatus TaxID=1061 RepID=A0A4U1JIM9_RHOCA|nr:hypothetical protein [Rhodobacter capsulatus]TKD12532.1 hypothetical protein FBT96_20310 [Rhodobacter capsulatus]
MEQETGQQGHAPTSAQGGEFVSIAVDVAQTQAAVQRLLAAGLFSAGSRAHVLLDYLIVEAHRHGPVPVKAYAIALDVLGRSAEFDPGTDSIVRVELGRLRKLLDLYYAGQGAQDPIRLSIPRGQSRVEILAAPLLRPLPRHPGPIRANGVGRGGCLRSLWLWRWFWRRRGWRSRGWARWCIRPAW